MQCRSVSYYVCVVDVPGCRLVETHKLFPVQWLIQILCFCRFTRLLVTVSPLGSLGYAPCEVYRLMVYLFCVPQMSDFY